MLAQSISADNTSTYEGNGQWKWTVFIKAPRETLNSIASVQYKLHSTFKAPSPVTSIGSISQAFGLTRVGWGTFEIGIIIKYKNGRTQSLKHNLKFTPSVVAQPKRIETGNTAVKTEKNWWKWSVFIKAETSVLNQIKCVEYNLHETFSNPIQLVCTRGVNNQKAFSYSTSGWGTFKIRIKVIYKDGKTQDLSHNLSF